MSNISRNDLVRYMTKHAGIPDAILKMLGRSAEGLGSAAMRGAGEVAATRGAAAAGKALGTGERAFGALRPTQAGSLAEGLAMQEKGISELGKSGVLGQAKPGTFVVNPAGEALRVPKSTYNGAPGSLIAQARRSMVGPSLPELRAAAVPKPAAPGIIANSMSPKTLAAVKGFA